MKKLIVILAVLALPATAALGASSNQLFASPNMFLESSLPASVHLFGRTTSCGPGTDVTIYSKALASSHRWHGTPAVVTKLTSAQKFSTHATIKPGPYSTVEIPVSAECRGHTFAHTNISVQAY